ncbi:actin-like protein arp8, partial [Coemansia spiralis]
APDDSPAIDALGIATPAAASDKLDTALTGDAGPATAAPAASGDAASIDNSPSLQPVSSATAASRSRQRRSRKDSVDDLVRSRFITNMASHSEGPRPDAVSPALRRAAEAAEHPPMAAITANVRDALAHERSAARGSPAAASPATGRQRNGHRSGHHGNGAAGYGSSARGAPQLGPIESRYSFPSYTPMNPRNVTSTMRRGEQGVGTYSRARAFEVPTGENVIVIHPGSRWLRIGRASDAVPRTIPHAIARRLRGRQAAAAAPAAPAAMDVDEPEPTSANTGSTGADGSDSDEDGSSPSDSEGLANGEELSAVDATLNMLRIALKQHQRMSKRKVAPNARSQVLSYNRQSKPEIIQDHNDPFRIEWLRSAEVTSDRVIGEEALRLDSTDEFSVRYPIRNGYFNIEDYSGIEEVLGDIEAIW